MKCHFYIDFDDASDMLRSFQVDVIRRKLNEITDLISDFVTYNRDDPEFHMESETHEKKKNEKKKIQ